MRMRMKHEKELDMLYQIHRRDALGLWRSYCKELGMIRESVLWEEPERLPSTLEIWEACGL